MSVTSKLLIFIASLSIAVMFFGCVGPSQLGVLCHGDVYEKNPDGSMGSTISGASVTLDFQSTDSIDSKTRMEDSGYVVDLSDIITGTATLYATHSDYADFLGWNQNPPLRITIDVNTVCPELPTIGMRRMIGTRAPNSTWKIAWDNGSATIVNDDWPEISLSDNRDKVVVLIIHRIPRC